MSQRFDPSRREFLWQSGMLTSGLLLAPELTWSASELVFDFRGNIPAGVHYRRPGPALMHTADGSLRSVDADVPRFPVEDGKPTGLLIEGEGRNYLRNANRPGNPGWQAGAGTHVSPEPEERAPDGSKGVFRVHRTTPASNSLYDAVIDAPWSESSTASVWLRSTAGKGTWRLRLHDFKTYNGVATVVEVGPEWKRYSLSYAWQAKDNGAKRFSILFNEPIAKPTVPPAPYLVNRINPYQPVATPLSLESVLMWGAQYETANRASSFIATAASPVTRATDNVIFPASVLDGDEGSITVVLPHGGRRGGVILDAGGESRGIRLGYSNSGWLVARVGGMEIAGFGDATRDTVVRLDWNGDGAQLSSGERPLSLTVRAVQRRKLEVDTGDTVRLGMTVDGKRPLDNVIASVAIGKNAGPFGQVVLPSVIPVSYLPSFADDFDDADVKRINENATGGTDGAPAWRSRYRQSRQEVINKEKQIYMDPAFAGTASAALGVQPFSIRNGVLSIRAEKADPTRVAPYIWNYRYTSGCISSELTHWQTYGYFEMRAKLPRGKGFWPAFWLLPKRNTWPPEIDVLEASGVRPYGVHCGVLEKPRKANSMPGAWIDQLIDTTDGFHTYAVDWTQSNIIFYVDGIKTFEYGPHGIHEDMYMLANLALGSQDQNWIPDPDATTPLPASMDIDYIRAFKRAA